MELNKSAVKKAIFIFQPSPALSGPIVDGGVMRVGAVKFCEKLQKALEEEGMEWKIELDDTNADIYEIMKKDFDALIYAPGQKTRVYIPKDLKQELKEIPQIYLEMLEYYHKDVKKVMKVMRSIQ